LGKVEQLHSILGNFKQLYPVLDNFKHLHSKLDTLGVLGTRELKTGSLESAKIVIGFLNQRNRVPSGLFWVPNIFFKKNLVMYKNFIEIWIQLEAFG